MNDLKKFLSTSYTAYHAVANAEAFLKKQGFIPLKEEDEWQLKPNGRYYVCRNASAIIAFTLENGNYFKVVASHTDSPCLKLKEHPVTATEPFYKLNVEAYGGGIYYSFFDRPLKIAGRIVTETENGVEAQTYCSSYNVTIPSVAVHQQRDVNEKFAPNVQVDLLPVLALTKPQWEESLGNPLSFDLYATCAEEPFESGMNGEFLSSPRIDNLSSVYGSLVSLCNTKGEGICVCACLDNEEIGSQTRQGASGDFLVSVLKRIAKQREMTEEDFYRAIASSMLVSLDNAHSLHPNHPEKCDPTNRCAMGNGIVIKSHANGAYTTDALSSAIIKKIFNQNGVKYQSFYNRSDMRSGSTLGIISLKQASILSVDLGLAQLAMHSAVETVASSDYEELKKGLNAFYESKLRISQNQAEIL